MDAEQWAAIDRFYERLRAAATAFAKKDGAYRAAEHFLAGAERTRQLVGLACGANEDAGGLRDPCVLPPGHAQREHQALDRNMFVS